MALDADTRQGGLGIQVQPVPERRAAAPHRLGVAGRRSRDRQHLRAERRRPGHRAQPRRQAAVGALVRRRVRRVHHARRPDDVAGHRRRPGDRQRRRLELGHRPPTARTASSRSTSAPATSSTSSNPGGRPYDTAYASPLIATINGMRLLIAGLGDGAIHAIKPQTGEKVWSFVAAKRAINTGVVVSGNTVFVSHGDENLEGNELGLIAAIDGAQTGDIKTTKWAVKGIEFGYSSPLVDGTRLYQIDNGSHAAGLRHRDGQGAVDAAARHRAEGAAGAGRRQDLRRHRRRQVLHRPAARRPRRDPEQGRAAEQHEQLLRLGRHAGADSRRRRDLARPHLLRVERRGLRDRLAARHVADRLRRRRAGAARPGRAGAPAGVADRAGARARADR